INPSKAFESIVTVKFYEYLACEVPVITCGRGLMKEIGDLSGAAITVEPKSPEKLAEEVRILKKSQIKINKLSGSGRRFVSTKYSRKLLATNLSSELKKQFTKTANL
ncbi:MAG: hypothetical protein ACQETF_10905, partial [Bacteroidota bacterium]